MRQPPPTTGRPSPSSERYDRDDNDHDSADQDDTSSVLGGLVSPGTMPGRIEQSPRAWVRGHWYNEPALGGKYYQIKFPNVLTFCVSVFESAPLKTVLCHITRPLNVLSDVLGSFQMFGLVPIYSCGSRSITQTKNVGIFLPIIINSIRFWAFLSVRRI